MSDAMLVMFTHTTDAGNKSTSQFSKFSNYCQKSNHSVSKHFRTQHEDKEKKTEASSRLKSPANSFNQYFEVYQN